MVMMMVQETMTETAPATMMKMVMALVMGTVMVLAATVGKQAVVLQVVQAAVPESWQVKVVRVQIGLFPAGTR